MLVGSDQVPEGIRKTILRRSWKLHVENRHLTRMLKGVVTNMHCLALLSLETGLLPYFGPAQYRRCGNHYLINSEKIKVSKKDVGNS